MFEEVLATDYRLRGFLKVEMVGIQAKDTAETLIINSPGIMERPLMSNPVLNSTDTGLEVLNLRDNATFVDRRLHTRDIALQAEGMQRLARAFVDRPDTILQELVNAAVELCGADSAGISIEKEDGTDAEFYHWVATAGQYSGFLNAVLPRYPSACGLCLERGQAQSFRVGQRFFDILGVEAPLVTDGILLPWQVDDTRGTIFVMAHGRSEAFDGEDARMMQLLAGFVAMGFRQQRQQKELMEKERAAAAAAMANELAHKINNPLQALTNQLYIASESDSKLAQEMSGDIEKLSALVKELLAIPFDTKSNKL
jgi:signal transduction histidine kinase